jgi:hypothetical protein
MARGLSAEPLLPTRDDQGDILAGLPKRRERLLSFNLDDPHAFRTFPKAWTSPSMDECLKRRDLIRQCKQAGIPTLASDFVECVNQLRRAT